VVGIAASGCAVRTPAGSDASGFSTHALTSASITVTAASNPMLSGGAVTVSGAGFAANKPVLVWLDTNGNGVFDLEEPVLHSALQTDAAGALPATSWLLNDVPAGAFSVRAAVCPDAPTEGLCTGTAADAEAPLTIEMGLSSSTFGGGNSVTVTGYGFAASSPLTVWYDTDSSGTSGNAVGSVNVATDAQGAFSATLVVSGGPGEYFVHAGPFTAPTATIPVHVETCWLQECTINGADTICLLGHSPQDLQFFGNSLADCKQVDSNYTSPTPITATHNPPGGYDLNNFGPSFLGAGVLAAATADFSLVGVPNGPGVPGSACTAMGAAIIKAEALGNAVPDKVSLLAIACSSSPFGVLNTYISGVELTGKHVPDKDVIVPAVGAIAPLAQLQPPVLLAVQATLAEAAVAGAIACGYVDYFCDGLDITATILEHPNLQQNAIPVTLFQPPIKGPPNPNPCAAVGVGGNCWGGLIGWAMPVCKSSPGFNANDGQFDSTNTGICERPDAAGNFSLLPVPGSVGSPHNEGATIECATGPVLGLSIGYDGDASFDVGGSDAIKLTNYHNFLPGPGGSEAPNGLDIEIPVSDRPLFQATLAALRPGMTVTVCGRWVTDMHMLWNELHPITDLSIMVPLTVTASDAGRPYGAADAPFTVSYSGFLAGDDASVLGGTLVCTTTATTASPVGTYPITCSGQTSTKYAITYKPGTLTVSRASLTVTASDASRSYGAANPDFSSSASGLVNGDSLASIGLNGVTCSTTATPSSPVGTYPIDCSGPSSTTNYDITYSAGTLTVTPASLTITANDATKVLHAPNPTFTATYSGLANADTASSLSGTLTCSTTAVTGSPIGSYPIVCSGQSATNYAITYLPGTLSVVYAGGGTCAGAAGHQILPPIDAAGTTVRKQGSTVPAKFRVCDANGLPIGDAGVVTGFRLVQVISGTSATNVDQAVSSTTPNATFRWDPSDQVWIFNVDTSDLAAGDSYAYLIRLDDGSAIAFRFALK
jgi:hypothetical protein